MRKCIVTFLTCLLFVSVVEAQYYEEPDYQDYQIQDQSQYYNNQDQYSAGQSQWIEDQWKWNGDGWSRIKGHYENPPKANMVWQAGHYKQHQYKKQWVPGEWKDPKQKDNQQVADQKQQTPENQPR